MHIGYLERVITLDLQLSAIAEVWVTKASPEARRLSIL